MSEHVVPRHVFVVVAVALFALLALTAFAAEIDLGPFNVLVALAIAGVKAGLVVLFFMEVRYRSPLTWIVAGAGVFWLTILITLTLSDVLSRGVVELPGW